MPDKKKDPGWFKNYFESTGDYMGWTPSEGDTSSSRKSAGRAIDRVVGKQISPNEARRIKGQKKKGRNTQQPNIPGKTSNVKLGNRKR